VNFACTQKMSSLILRGSWVHDSKGLSIYTDPIRKQYQAVLQAVGDQLEEKCCSTRKLYNLKAKKIQSEMLASSIACLETQSE